MSKWIPTEEKNPERDGFYMATLDGEIAGEREPFSGIAEFFRGKWVDDEDDYKCILAWMPMPKPYRKRNTAHMKKEGGHMG